MRVLISGAGIAGPTLAYWLSRCGAQITVVEKSQHFLAQGQNIDVKGPSLTILKKMGVMDQIRRWHTGEKGAQFVDASGKPFAQFPLTEHGISPTAENEILRGDLAEVLYSATKQDPNVRYMFNTTIQEILANSEDHVKVKLSDESVHDFDIAVAADGQWSKLRRLCFPPEEVKVVDKNMYVTYFTVPRIESDNDLWNIYCALDSRIITTRPDPHGTYRAMFSLMPDTTAQKKMWNDAARSDRKTQQELLRSEFADAGWQARRLLDDIDQAPDFYMHPLQQIKMSRWSSSRVVCIGDAAHAPTPLTGMGTPLSIMGAYVLAGEISKLEPGEHPSRAFEAYERLFHPFTDEVQQIPWFVPAVAHPAVAWKRWILQTTLATVARIVAIPWVANKVQLGDPEADDSGFKMPFYSKFATIRHPC